jgi:hypothetical protein
VDSQDPVALTGIEPLLPLGLGKDGQLSRWQVSTRVPWALEPYG